MSKSPGGLEGGAIALNPILRLRSSLRSGHFTKIDIDKLRSQSEAIQAMASRKVSNEIVVVSDYEASMTMIYQAHRSFAKRSGKSFSICYASLNSTLDEV